jgi:hypothetical protein
MQLIQRDILRSYTLEVTATAIGQTTFTFPDIPFLRNKIAYAIEASVGTIMVTSGKTNQFSQATFLNTYSGFITLVDSNNNQFVQNMPLKELMTKWYNNQISPSTIGANQPYNTNGLMVFSDRIVQWNKCSLYFPTSPISATTQGFQFIIYYK